MRPHGAAERVLGLVCLEYPGIGRIGAHIAEDKARVDFGWPTMDRSEIPTITDRGRSGGGGDFAIRSEWGDRAADGSER